MPLNSDSKNILLIAPSAYPLGGVATWVAYVVPGLRARGWNVTVGLVEGRFHNVDAYLAVHPEEQVLRIPCGTGTREGRVRNLSRALCDVQPTIVVSVNIADVASAIDRIRETFHWSPRVAMALHAVQPDFISSIDASAEILDAVICTNRLACEIVARRTSLTRDRIYYAPYGVEMNQLSSFTREYSDRAVRIAYVGRLERAQKRVEDIVAIVAELDQRRLAYELLIAGDGPDGEWLRSQLSGPENRGRVRFLGTLVGTDLEQVYSLADALLITSLWETGPIVAWEAMANQVAVVTSAYVGSGLEDSLKPGDNCLMFPIGDAVSAANCIESLGDTKLRHRLHRGGLALVASRYSRPASIEQWSAALAEILAKSPRPPSHNHQSYTAGRLDTLFGLRAGETIRELLRLKYDHSEPGGEWPHVNLDCFVDASAFWQHVVSLDGSPLSKVYQMRCGAEDAAFPEFP